VGRRIKLPERRVSRPSESKSSIPKAQAHNVHALSRVLFFRDRVTVKCPACSSDLRLSELKYGIKESFRCSACKQWLCISPAWVRWLYYGPVPFAFGITAGLLWFVPMPRVLFAILFGPVAFGICFLMVVVIWVFVSVLFPPPLVCYHSDRDLSLNLHDRP
jgi:hypothetical protein